MAGERVGGKKFRELEEQLDTYGLVASNGGVAGRYAPAGRGGSCDEGRDGIFRNMHIVMYWMSVWSLTENGTFVSCSHARPNANITRSYPMDIWTQT
jgi:hypothetical protein